MKRSAQRNHEVMLIVGVTAASCFYRLGYGEQIEGVDAPYEEIRFIPDKGEAYYTVCYNIMVEGEMVEATVDITIDYAADDVSGWRLKRHSVTIDQNTIENVTYDKQGRETSNIKHQT